MKLSVSSGRALRVLLSAILFLLAAGLLGQASKYFLGHGRLEGLVPLFDLDSEANLPSWYSSVVIFSCAGMLWAHGVLAKKSRAGYSRHWFALSAVFFFLSADEVGTIHEKITAPLNQYFNATGFFYHSWVIAAIPAVAVFVLAFQPFLRHLSPAIRSRFWRAGAVYIAGVLGVEMVSGPFDISTGANGFGYSLMVAAEEGLEMLGMALFAHALLLNFKTAAEPAVLAVEVD